MEEDVGRNRKVRMIMPIVHWKVKIFTEEEKREENLTIRSSHKLSNNSSYRWEGLAQGT